MAQNPHEIEKDDEQSTTSSGDKFLLNIIRGETHKALHSRYLPLKVNDANASAVDGLFIDARELIVSAHFYIRNLLKQMIIISLNSRSFNWRSSISFVLYFAGNDFLDIFLL